MTFGYFDATMQPGGVGAVEYSIQMSGYRSYEGAYEVFTSEDCDSSEKAVLVPLYVLKGMGETASSALLLYGAKTQFTAGMPARTAGRTAVGRVAARDTALERAAFEENIALESRLAVKTARREAALAKAAYREELIALESREAIRAAGVASKSGLRTASEAGISPADATRLQNAANRTQQRITVVGSRAEGTAKATSDWDYIMSGKSSQRHSARSSVPRGTQGGEINSMGRETGIDVFQDYNPNAPGYSPLNTSKPHVIFEPQ